MLGVFILVVVNLNPYHTHSGWVELPLESLRLPAEGTYQVHDLLTEALVLPAHIFRVRRHVRTEKDFDYFA